MFGSADGSVLVMFGEQLESNLGLLHIKHILQYIDFFFVHQ